MKKLMILIIVGCILTTYSGCRWEGSYLLPLEPAWGWNNNSWNYYGGSNGWNTWNNQYYGTTRYGAGNIYWGSYQSSGWYGNSTPTYGGVFLPGNCTSTCGLRYQGDYYYNGYPVRYFNW